MEDGKKRHLFLLEDKKKEVLKMLPNTSLKENVDYMRQTIEGRSFPRSLFDCCLTKKFKRVNPQFKEAFEGSQTSDRINYYRKYLDSSLTIANKKSNLPETTNHLEGLEPKDEQIDLHYSLNHGKKWRSVKATLCSTTKILQSPQFKIDFHKSFVNHFKDERTGDEVISIIPWRGRNKQMEIRVDTTNKINLFQRVQFVHDSAIGQNIVRLIDGEDPLGREQDENVPMSERSLRDRMVEEMPVSQIHAVREVELVSYLTYRHPRESLPPSDKLIRLIPKQNMPYYLQGEYEISQDGELIAINKQKLQAQGSVIKYIIKRLFSGSKLFSISLPVTVFNEQSNLSLLLSSYRHAPLQLDLAAKQISPLGRFLKVIRFALLSPHCYIRCDKPFNPLLGETYQATVDGTLICGQQISHHPPISSIFIKGRGYTAYGHFQAQLKFGVNSANGNNKGWFNVSFDTHDISKKVIRFNNAPGQMGGMVFGSRTLNLKGHIYFIDQQNFLFCKLAIGNISIQKKVKQYNDSVEGKIVRLKKQTNLLKQQNITQKDYQEQLGLISGRWQSEVFFKGVLLINIRKQYPPEVERYPALLPSDYSLRQDILNKRTGDEQASQTAKQKLQELQREDRRLREQYYKKG